MPEDDINKQQSQDTDPPEESIHDEQETPINPVNIPRDVIQEQIPPVHSDRAPKSVIIRRTIFLLIGIILVVAIGLAAWKFIPSKNETPKPAQSNQNQTQSSASAPADLGIGDTALSQDYKSDFLRMNFKYPGSWKVSEQNNSVTVKSPTFNLQENNGMQSTGYFKIYIARGASATDGKYLGKGYAVAPSEKITYSEPVAGQRKDTYLTNFGIDTPDNFAYCVVQGNFNLAAGDTLGPKFASEPDSFLITGGFATDGEKDGLATKVVSQDYFATNQAYKAAVEIIKSLQLK